MAGAGQSANDSELELSRKKKLPSVGDRQKTTREKRRADYAAPPRGGSQTTPLTHPQDVQGCIEADPRTRLYQRRYEAHFAKNITI